MPEHPAPRLKPHPWTACRRRPEPPPPDAPVPAPPRRTPVGYAELHVTSNYTFLTGASHPEELVERAAALGHRAVAITDRNSLAGIVRAHVAAKEAGVRLVVGCRVEVGGVEAREVTSSASPRGDTRESTGADREPSPPCLPILVYPTSRPAYANLCRLLTRGKRRASKGECDLDLHDLVEHEAGLLAVVVPPDVLDRHFLEIVAGLRRVFTDDRLSLAAACPYGPDDHRRLSELRALAAHVHVPLVATNDVLYHVPERRVLQDVVTCIRHGVTIDEAGFRLEPNAERHLKSPEEMARLFANVPGAIARSVAIAERTAGFTMDALRYEYPDEVCPPGRTPMEHLRDLTRSGARQRYPDGIPDRVQRQIEHEFDLIDELAYAPYFLTVHDLVVFARARGILCQGRGAAANSAVCYCLGVTAVDPARTDLLFERFVSRERDEPPDIDIDFEHERREEVIQYIYAKYGRERAALTAEVITYRGRSAIREAGKALGLSLDCVARLAGNLDWWHDGVGNPDRLRELGLDPDDPTLRRLMTVARDLLGFPRHLSQHVGGFVITRAPLCELVPIENAAMPDRTVIEWDKDDIEAMGMLKVDVLGLGMLTCIRKALDLVNATRPADAAPLALHTVPAEDPAVYDMACAADTVGVFQIESRAQMSMLPRLRPRCFYDLVIEVAIVRPGPIQGDMVHPYLRRRSGEEPVTYPSAAVERILAKTLGVPLFQEQAMALAIVAAGFTPGEADELRRAMAAWKRKGNQIERFGTKLVAGMLARGYARDFADRCFAQIKGFSEYGFPESHAASFALLVYVSAWLKRHHPAAFAAALINSQPMGFYAPAQIVRDAQEHGVEVRPIDVNASAWDCTLETAADGGAPPALRLGLRLIRGLRRDDAEHIVAAVRAGGSFATIPALRNASDTTPAVLRRLATADAFRSMGIDRQRALWAVRRLPADELPLFAGLDDPPPTGGTATGLPAVPLPRRVVQDYEATQLSLKAHPVAFLRTELHRRNVLPSRALTDPARTPNGRPAAVAGLVLVRQRPSTAGGIVFMTLEDETGIGNLIVRPHIYERERRIARHGVFILARGRIERQGDVVHVLVEHFESLDDLMDVAVRSRDFH